MKLVVEVHDASDLMPKDGHGSASPFVEVEFDQQRQRTQTKLKDLNPSWGEKLQFNVSDPNNLPHQTIDVVVYNDRQGGHHKNFLGRVRISGVSVPDSESESQTQRYPLDKRGLFSNIRGDIALRIYAIHDHPMPRSDNLDPPIVPPPELSNENGGLSNGFFGGGKKKKNNNKSYKDETKHKEGTQSWYSIPTSTSTAPPPFDFSKPAAPSTTQGEEKRADPFVAPQPAAVALQMPIPLQKKSEFDLTETAPPLPARLRRMGFLHDKTSSTYDLVEPMHFLYVRVVKAKDLPTMDISGSLDPYVQVKLGNFLGTTKHYEKNQNPVWDETFAFCKEHMQSNLLEVIVKDKDLVKDDFVGRVQFGLVDLHLRVPPDSPLAPEWYKLEDRKGDKAKGEIMLAVWKGTQADEAYPNARHSDTLNLSQEAVAHTRSQVYYSPRLYYLRVQVLEAQDLVLPDKGRLPDPVVKVRVGAQIRATKASASKSVNAMWNDELMFVVSEPYNEYMEVFVEDRVGPQKSDILGRLRLRVSEAAFTRADHTLKPAPSRWFDLSRPFSHGEEEGGEKKKEGKFSSKIHLRIILDAGYHVLDESTHFSSDLQPSARPLRKPNIGILELGILNARALSVKNAYCVAKYGSKWVRTRTLVDNHSPQWQEQYTWEVFDPCTVITIAVFDNHQVFAKKEDGNQPPKDQKIGKLRIRLSTLETDRVYTHFYPLLILHPSGLKKMGELHLSLRFTCIAWVNMVALYSRPLLPKMHYVNSIPVHLTDFLRHQAILIVAERLSRSEPPLRREAVEYMLDVDPHMWSLRRSKANFNRITSVMSGLVAVGKWFDDVRNWKNPITTILVHVLFFILVCYPELVLPTLFLYLFLIGIWNYRFRPRHPPHMDVVLSNAERPHPDELDEEFDTFPTSRPSDIVRMRYDRLRSVAGRMQTVAGDLAMQGERAQALLSWRDPRASGIFVFFALCLAVVLYVTPFQVVCVLAGLFLLRHPRFRYKKMPSVPFNFYRRLPSKSDSHKVGKSSLQTSELLDVGEMEGPALDLFKAKLEAVMAEARSQQAASMTEFHWLGHRFPITNAKTRVSILKAQELEKSLHDSVADSLPAEKKLSIFDKIFAAYHEARSCIRSDLVTAGNAENVKDDLNGLDKAVSAVLGQRTIERNQLLVDLAKSKLTRQRDDKGEKVTKPEELVRLYDLLIQNTTDLSDLVSSGRDRKPEEVTFAEEYVLKGLVFRAERCFYLAKSYSLAGKRTEAYVLYCHARSLTDAALQQLQSGNTADKGMIQELKVLSNNCRSNSCIEHAAAIMEEEKAPEKLSKGVSALSLKGVPKKPEKFLLESLDVYESAVGELNLKGIPHIEVFPPAFQAVACNPIVLDIAFNSIDFPSLENRMKKEKKSIFGRLWR